MRYKIDAIKQTFRAGRRDEAIAECEALLFQSPANPEIRRLCATLHAMTGGYPRALELFNSLRTPGQEDPEVLFNIGTCEKELGSFAAAADTFTAYTQKFPGDAGGWGSLAECKFELNDVAEGIRLARQAIRLDSSLAPELAALRVARGDRLHSAGKLLEAAEHYGAALTLTPGDAATLKKATLCLLESNRGEEAIELCREALKKDPSNLTAKLGAEWLLSSLVPLWHVPMMNEPERNQAFFTGMQSAVDPDKTVFEIGTGSGLLAMMAAKLGARHVFTCEAVSLIAATAVKVIQKNGYQDRITVLSKPSHAVEIGKDLPARADVLVHEIFSSELLGEHVLAAIEDAKARLLRPGGRILPSAASIMVALVSGDALEKNLYAGESFGFDLREFNAIQPKKRPLYREDLEPRLISDAVEAFRFDFMKQSTFPPERKQIKLVATADGLCHGLIQWIRIELGEGIMFENHPGRARPVSNWQHSIYGFDAPMPLHQGIALAINAWHDRSRPWFELAR